MIKSHYLLLVMDLAASAWHGMAWYCMVVVWCCSGAGCSKDDQLKPGLVENQLIAEQNSEHPLKNVGILFSLT